MTTSTQQTNRRIAVIGFGAAVILTGAIALLNPGGAPVGVESPPSTFFTTDQGARAIYRVFQEVLPDSEQWRLPLTELRNYPDRNHSTLVVMGPQVPLSEGEADALDKWIMGGGQLILATNNTWDVGNPAGILTQPQTRSRPPDFLARHHIDRGFGTGAEAVTAAEIRDLGDGRIVYLPDSYAFSNETLRTSDNAVWLAKHVSQWGKVALFDEYHHGFATKRGFFSLIGLFLFSSPWGFACLQLALAGAVFVFGCRRRFGKIVEESPAERTSPLEAAEALGGLFHRAQAHVLSARSIHQHLNMELSRLTGYRVDLVNAESRERVARRSRMSKADLDGYAEVVKEALDKPVQREAELVKIARTAANILRSVDHGTAGRKRHAAVS
jgi:hypothetical protein